MNKVVFVCLGNICRSPMAEFIMKALDQDGSLHIESRATSSWEHGNPVHQGTQKILRKYAVSFDSSKGSQQISQSDFEFFDLIVGMDESNVEDLLQVSAGRYDDKIKLFRPGGVPDPWYTGDFEETYNLVTAACQDFLYHTDSLLFVSKWTRGCFPAPLRCIPVSPSSDAETELIAVRRRSEELCAVEQEFLELLRTHFA